MVFTVLPSHFMTFWRSASSISCEKKRKYRSEISGGRLSMSGQEPHARIFWMMSVYMAEKACSGVLGLCVSSGAAAMAFQSKSQSFPPYSSNV